MERSDKYKFCSFDAENSILNHDVTVENSFNEESYLTSIIYFTTLIHKYQPKNLFVRIFKSPNYFDQKLGSFMNIVVAKTIRNVGVRKIAFYFSDPEFEKSAIPKFNELSKSKEFTGPFKTKTFSDIRKAKKWLMKYED